MEHQGHGANDAPDDGHGADGAQSAPGIQDTLRDLGTAGRATWAAAREASQAFRILLAADVSLARSAFGRTLAFTGVAIAAGASTWLLLMAALALWLSGGLGLSWSISLLITALLSAAVTGIGGWRAMVYFEHTRLQATRRQLARLGIGELAGFMPDAGSGASAEDATDRVSHATDKQAIKKGLGVDITPP